MKIDIFCHILPPKYREALHAEPTLPDRQRKTHNSVPVMCDVQHRIKVMDKFEGLQHVLTLGPPAIETYLDPQRAAELAMLVNEEMAELVFKYPDKFPAAVASLPMNNMDAALLEIDRAINELKLKGIQVYSPINDKPLDSPEFAPLWEKMSQYNLPIWIHPARPESFADYRTENKVRYEANKVFGWPYEMTIAMSRIVFSGILERYPNLKIITHYCGGMVPQFEQRISRFYDLNEIRQFGDYDPRLPKYPLEYFKMFYNDTATDGSTPALMCAYAFFGADHILFGTDMHSEQQIDESIRSIERMEIPDLEKKKIFEDNARSLLGLLVP